MTSIPLDYVFRCDDGAVPPRIGGMLKPVETMNKSMRYLAVIDNSESDMPDAWSVVFWHSNGYWSNAAYRVAEIAKITNNNWNGLILKGWALELSPL